MGYDTRKEFADFLRRIVFAATLTGIRGIHGHKVLVGIAEEVDLIVVVLASEVDTADIVENLGKLFATLLDSSAEFVRINVDVGE